MPGIAADHHAPLPAGFRPKRVQEIVPKACRYPADSIAVHPVCTCPHNPAQPAGAKLQVLVKTVFDLFLIRNRSQFAACLFIKKIIIQPELKVLSVIHFVLSPYGFSGC